MLIWLRAQARSLCLFKYKLYNFKHSISEKIIKGVEKMIYNKPELNAKKFDLVEEIMESGNSATDPTEPDVDIKSKSGSSSIGSDLIIG